MHFRGGVAMKYVLLVDDDEDMLALTSRWLTKGGYEVATAVSGQAAIDAIRERRPDLVLLDYVMKVNNKKLNKELIETIAGQWKRLNIETVKEAMDICRREHNKVKKSVPITKKVKTDNSELPKWFDQKIDSNKENLDELTELLKDFN